VRAEIGRDYRPAPGIHPRTVGDIRRRLMRDQRRTIPVGDTNCLRRKLSRAQEQSKDNRNQ